MELCHTKYCDFVVWNKDQFVCQRVVYDEQFIKAKIIDLEEFVIKCILPELIAKWFTKHELSTGSSGSRDSSDVPHHDADEEHATENVTTTRPSSDSVGTAGPDNDMNLKSAQSHTHNDDDEHAHSDDDSTEELGAENLGTDVCSSSGDTTNSGSEQWCYCRQDEDFDYLIGCDNQHCQIQWFHLSCVNMTMDEVPDGDWFCPDCRHQSV